MDGHEFLVSLLPVKSKPPTNKQLIGITARLRRLQSSNPYNLLNLLLCSKNRSKIDINIIVNDCRWWR